MVWNMATIEPRRRIQSKGNKRPRYYFSKAIIKKKRHLWGMGSEETNGFDKMTLREPVSKLLRCKKTESFPTQTCDGSRKRGLKRSVVCDTRKAL